MCCRTRPRPRGRWRARVPLERNPDRDHRLHDWAGGRGCRRFAGWPRPGHRRALPRIRRRVDARRPDRWHDRDVQDRLVDGAAGRRHRHLCWRARTKVGLLYSCSARPPGPLAPRFSLPLSSASLGRWYRLSPPLLESLAALVPLAVPLAASGDVAGWALISALACVLNRRRFSLLYGGGDLDRHRRGGRSPSPYYVAADQLGHVLGRNRSHCARGCARSARRLALSLRDEGKSQHVAGRRGRAPEVLFYLLAGVSVEVCSRAARRPPRPALLAFQCGRLSPCERGGGAGGGCSVNPPLLILPILWRQRPDSAAEGGGLRSVTLSTGGSTPRWHRTINPVTGTPASSVRICSCAVGVAK